MCSVAASIATAAFNEHFGRLFPEKKIPGLFDCRAFSLPRAEVVNYFIWRQNDATRNSILTLGQAHFSHKQLHGKNVNQIQDMLVLEKGINWNNCSPTQKRGFCVKKTEGGWAVDHVTPIFTQHRDYLQQHVDIEEE